MIGMVFKKGWNKVKKGFKDGVENSMSELKKEVEKNGKEIQQEVKEETVGLQDLMKRVFDVPNKEIDFVIEGKTDVDFLTGVWSNENQRRSIKVLCAYQKALQEEKHKREKVEMELENEKNKTKDYVNKEKDKLDDLVRK